MKSSAAHNTTGSKGARASLEMLENLPTSVATATLEVGLDGVNGTVVDPSTVELIDSVQGSTYPRDSAAANVRDTNLTGHLAPSFSSAALNSAGLPNANSEPVFCKDTEAKKSFKWNEKRTGTRALVEKTKEALLMQMAVDTRKAEILKLHDRAAEKSEALKVAESLLSRDAQKFDEFLRSSDAAAHEAIRRADEAARATQEKAVSVRQLRQKLDNIKARAAANRDKVDEYSRYKIFLAHITPQDWLKKQEELTRDRVQQQKQQWVQRQLQQQQQQFAADLEAIDDDLQERLYELDKKKPRGSKAASASRKELEEKSEKRKAQLTKKLKSAVDFEAAFDAEALAVASVDLYFQDPHEPLRLFRELEEENLFLIQNAHENATELEAMEKRFAETRVEMGARLAGLEAVISQLQRQLHQQREKCRQHTEELSLRRKDPDAFGALQKLTSYVAAIHAACGFEKEGSPDCLRMLEQIEARVDTHLAALAKHEAENPELVHQLEKSKEKQRRERARQEKLAQQHLKTDERLVLSLRQSGETARRQARRPIMFRSKPFQKREEVNAKAEGESEAALDYELYFQ